MPPTAKRVATTRRHSRRRRAQDEEQPPRPPPSIAAATITHPHTGSHVLAFLDRAGLAAAAAACRALRALVSTDAVWAALLAAERPHLARLLPHPPHGAKALYRECVAAAAAAAATEDDDSDEESNDDDEESDEEDDEEDESDVASKKEEARLRQRLAGAFLHLELRNHQTGQLHASAVLPFGSGGGGGGSGGGTQQPKAEDVCLDGVELSIPRAARPLASDAYSLDLRVHVLKLTESTLAPPMTAACDGFVEGKIVSFHLVLAPLERFFPNDDPLLMHFDGLAQILRRGSQQVISGLTIDFHMCGDNTGSGLGEEQALEMLLEGRIRIR